MVEQEASFIIWKQLIIQLIIKTIENNRRYQQPSTMLLISRHPYLPLSLVEKNKFLRWDMISIQNHPDMTRKFYQKHYKYSSYHNDYYQRIKNRKMQVHFQGKHSFNFVNWESQPFSKIYLSYHPHIPIPLILKFHTFKWDFTFLLLYRQWTCQQIMYLIRIRKMDWKLYSRNPYLTTQTLYTFITFPWDWNLLASHPCFPPQNIFNDDILFCHWKWKNVFKNPRITPSFWKVLIQSFPNICRDPLIILHNHFNHSTSVQHWATFHIHCFYSHYNTRRRIHDKIQFMKYIKQKLYTDLTHHILTFI